MLIDKTLKNRYRVEKILGHGGMAEVYKVYDLQRGVPLAMKVLREDLAEDRVFLRRFQREAQNLAKLQHPNIVRFYGLEQEGRLAFILMDYIEGTTLRGLIFDENGPLPDQKILDIMQPVCSALNYAHQQGIVHCDLKSANIMIDKFKRVYLTDFGIARMTDNATSTMVGIGTPAYMAPELIKGLDPTPQSDIYSLGIVLYEMLTGGERPFIGERATITGTTAEKVRWEHLNLEAPYVSQINPKASRNIDQIIAKCLAKDPRQRYTSPLNIYSALINTMEKKVSDSEDKQELSRVSEIFDKKESIISVDTPNYLENKYGNAGEISPENNNFHKTASTNGKRSPGKKVPVLANIILLVSAIVLIVSALGGLLGGNEVYDENLTSKKPTATSGVSTKERKALEDVSLIESNAVEIPLEKRDGPYTLVENNMDDHLECKTLSDNLSNFILEARLINPFEVKEGWDYGILFRAKENDDQYWLWFSNSGQWYLELVGNKKDYQGNFVKQTIAHGYSASINTGGHENNRYRLVISSTKGFLFINDDFVSKLDLSDHLTGGAIEICTDILSSHGTNRNTYFLDYLRLWELP